MRNNIAEWRQQAKNDLAKFSDDADIETIALLKNLLSRNTAWILAHPEFILSAENLDVLNNQLRQLINGEPLAYVTNHIEFFGLPFFVNKNVLIPRPDTEILVEKALEWCGNQTQPLKFVDVGTGSGCIGISILFYHPGFIGFGIDISFEALRVAKENRKLLKNAEFQLIQADLLSFTNEKFDLVCANLPYIPRSHLQDLLVARFEPLTALDGGVDGTDFIKRLLKELVGQMNRPGLVLLEIQFDQGKIIHDFALEFFPDADISVIKDLSGNDRVVSIEMKP